MAISVDLGGQVALVTGGATGLGKAAARILARAGCRVFVTGRRTAPLEAAAAEIGATAIPGDIAADGAAEAIVQRILAETGRLDILVNAAGVAARGPAEEMTLADVDYLIAVNIRGLFQCCQAAGKAMRKARRGKVINVGSIASEIGTPNIAFYGTTKGAVRQLTKSLAVEWAGDNIQVNAVLPGWFRTEMTEGSFRNPDWTAKVRGRIPMGREGDPADIEGAFLFLASGLSDYVTGVMLPVDGGVLAS